ncbi:MAG: hypothetical protein QOJ10_2036 [Chloroflexota bacterium]|nr:hypothetical protein [Chloroflexota bacterium]
MSEPGHAWGNRLLTGERIRLDSFRPHTYFRFRCQRDREEVMEEPSEGNGSGFLSCRATRFSPQRL